MTEMLLSHADGEKLKDSFDFSHVGAFYCSISLRIRQGQAPMAVAAIASGSKSKNSSAFEHEKSTPSKMKECCVLCH